MFHNNHAHFNTLFPMNRYGIFHMPFLLYKTWQYSISLRYCNFNKRQHNLKWKLLRFHVKSFSSLSLDSLLILQLIRSSGTFPFFLLLVDDRGNESGSRHQLKRIRAKPDPFIGHQCIFVVYSAKHFLSFCYFIQPRGIPMSIMAGISEFYPFHICTKHYVFVLWG